MILIKDCATTFGLSEDLTVNTLEARDRACETEAELTGTLGSLHYRSICLSL